MIYFSPAKINLGLNILERREDGFHNLRSIMVPNGLCDIIEIIPQSDTSPPFSFTTSGLSIASDPNVNLCWRAWELMTAQISLPSVKFHLHKQIPMGAGLGGGSSNGTTTLLALNKLADRPLTNNALHELAAQLGSDCPFFLHNVPMMMEARGDQLSNIALDLSGLHLVLLNPGIHISTSEAYGLIRPKQPAFHLKDLGVLPRDRWSVEVTNDFEEPLSAKYVEIMELKTKLYEAGAIFASMSGSGSSVYGFFTQIPSLPDEVVRHLIWKGRVYAGVVT